MINATPLKVLQLFAIVALVSVLPDRLQSQDRWKLLDMNLESGFETDLEWPRPGARMFWRDSLIGYYHTFTENNIDGGLHAYYTSDGGRTWQLQSNPDPIPHYFLDPNFAHNPDGFFTKDGGKSWKKLTATYTDTNFFPDPELKYTITNSMAGTPNDFVALYKLHDAVTPGSLDSVPFGPYRLAFSRDCGASWVFVDSLKYFGKILQELSVKTKFGNFQAPANMTDTTSNGWWQLFYMPSDSIALVGTKAYGTVDGNRENHFYLGHLNLNTFAAQWFKLPFIEPLFPPPAVPLDFQYVNDTTIYIIQSEFVDVFNNPDDKKWTVWRSANSGKDWTSENTPDWVDYRSLRFVGTYHGVASNAITNDGGRTWTEWGHPFGTDPLFYAVDSTHYKLANRFSLFASSGDAGHRWWHNEAGGIPLSVSAFEGNVLVGRNYQSIIISADSGESWRDVGAEGKLPSSLSQVLAIARPDPGFDPNRIVGVATFVEYDATFHIAVIESNDGGEVWSVGQELPELIGSVGKVKLLFTGDPEAELGPITGFLYGSKGLWVSENGGVTWTLQNDQHSFEQLTMPSPEAGVAVTSSGIYTTGDGGKTWTLEDSRTAEQNTSLGTTYISGNSYVAMFSDKNVGYQNWSYEERGSDGSTWSAFDGTGATRPMNIGAYWGDSANVHTVARAGVIQHSSDAGRTFSLRNDSVETFVGLAGYVEAGQELDYLYVVAPGNEAGRYFLHRVRPLSVPFDRDPAIQSAWLTTKPVRNGEAILGMELRQPTELTIKMYDMVGRPVIQTAQYLRGTGEHQIALDVNEVVSGRYTLEITTQNGVVHVPLVVVK